MKVSLILAAVAVLLALCVITPVQALAKGDCIVELPITTGTLIGLDKSKFVYKAPYTNSKGAAKKVTITVTQASASDAERGAASGKVVVVFPAGTQCNFTNSALDKKDPGFAALKTALKGLTISCAPAGSGFGN
ncbi:hypothetical protein MNEG_10992 [Monoraphidium neglectum]|uniref:Uncharacterized protein n=1 Tax=Monoraphidium neglectum TaxID=145388 RepID=A0A0D2KMM5_9CHLO|nr:hypothetical protein MNEG_10992 [Monoraphidium neglectum]KIY96968.1 hypothetical protein MNEG_10992 [Monoraphidium neglectum]|eukprot:XP_013895988.1 hypothetical protein MNEG_10992 [Monoraphidium neglectum]